MPEELTVNLAERSYTITLGVDLAGDVSAEVRRLTKAGRKVAVLADSNVARLHAPALRAMFGDAPVLHFPAGEESKNLTGLGRVLDFLAAEKLDRASALFVVGGGVIGDLGGFAAASYLRGIDYFQVPTTLLAMVDSSVGGKTGVNLSAGKNLAGSFHQPRGVYVMTGLLATLPPREFAAGMAEVIKYGLLGDAALFKQLERSPLTAGSGELGSVIRRCCEIKAGIVAADERELASEGGRALLNLGHTFGHAIEQVTRYGVYLHGEAVAVGLAAAARLSQKLSLIAAGDVARIEAVIAAHALPVRLRAPLKLTDLAAALSRDKKARAGAPRWVVLKAVGSAVVRGDVAPALIDETWREVGAAA
jgi:3-dehydroquinate synthase